VRYIPSKRFKHKNINLLLQSSYYFPNMGISHKEEEANLTCALNELKDSTFRMIEILNKPIHVDVCHECTKCQTRTIIKNQLLFKKDSIIFRASFVYNLLYEIYNISLDAIKGKACAKDIEQIREEISTRICIIYFTATWLL